MASVKKRKLPAGPPPAAWERQPKEGTAAFAAFKVYLDLGSGRTAQATADAIGKGKSMVDYWSQQWDWPERVRRLDVHRDRVEQEAKDRENAKRAALWERRRLDMQERCFGIASSLMRKADEMLAFPLDASKWTLATTATMYKLAAEIASQAIHEALDDREIFDPTGKTPEECKAYVEREEARSRARRQATGASS